MTEAKTGLLIEELCKLTQQQKLTWHKVTISPKDYYYRSEHREFCLAFSAHLLGRGERQNLGVDTLDIFGKRASSYLLPCSKGDLDKLITCVEGTNPRSFPFNDYPFNRKSSTDFTDKILFLFSLQ